MRQLVKPRKTVMVSAGLCLKYARLVFGAPALYRSAWHGWLNAPGRHPGELPPAGVGVVLWFSHWGSYQDGQGRYGTHPKDPMYGNWGHVVIQHADGTLWSSPGRGYGFKRFKTIREVESYFNAKYVGWSEGINNVLVVEATGLAPVPGVDGGTKMFMMIRNGRYAVTGPGYWFEFGGEAAREAAQNILVQITGNENAHAYYATESMWNGAKKAAKG